jgi:hypothetical protein
VRPGERDAEFRRMFAQGRGLLARELDIVGGYLDVLLAQILGEDSANLAISNEADLPSFWVNRHGLELP